MLLRVRKTISPCIVKDTDTGIGVPLVPGQTIDTDRYGIDGSRLFEAYRWAFDMADDVPVEDASAKPGAKRNTKRAASA